jgi:glycosyltransferase involved in cell wall biosynthesis
MFLSAAQRRWNPALLRKIRKLGAVMANTRCSPPVEAGGPLVSVIIATYNWSSVLRYAIHTALWQTYSNIEVLVIGDGCTDDSEEVTASFGDPRIRWYNLPKNSGSQAGPNSVGLELARGEYIAYFGHDDVWLPSHLAWLMQGVSRTDSLLAHTLTELIGPEGNYHGFSTPPKPSSLLHEVELGREIGWRDYRLIIEGPDDDFIRRAGERTPMLTVPVLTVFKFPANWRKNSYIERPSHEQAAYVRRIESERAFIYRELIAIGLAALRHVRSPELDFPEPPYPLAPGWRVTQLRKARGLE